MLPQFHVSVVISSAFINDVGLNDIFLVFIYRISYLIRLKEKYLKFCYSTLVTSR